MARITVEDCIDKFESRFELVLVASNRARKLHTGEKPTIEKNNDKNTVIALREIADETLDVKFLKQELIEEFQNISPLDEEDLSLEHSSLENVDSEESNEEMIFNTNEGNSVEHMDINENTEDLIGNNHDDSIIDSQEDIDIEKNLQN